MKDYYSILRVSRSADVETIKRSYRLLVQKYHPDINPDPKVAELIQEINEAYDVLSDSLKKKEYDFRFINPTYKTPVSQQAPHRDPRYRRPTTHSHAPTSSYYTQTELMQQYLPHMLWICRAGILFVAILFFDKVLPAKTIVEDITSIYVVYRGKSRAYAYDIIETKSGMSIKMYDHKATYFYEQNRIKVDRTPILGIATVVYGEDGINRILVGVIFRTLVFLPILLLSTSAFGVLFRRKIEFSFSLSIISGVLLVINLYLI